MRRKCCCEKKRLHPALFDRYLANVLRRVYVGYSRICIIFRCLVFELQIKYSSVYFNYKHNI